jgi:hypothetical protein
MLDPLYQVLGDARRLYRFHAAWLLCVSAALFLPAAALDVLITSRHWPGAWCYASDCSAAFLLLAIVAARVPAEVQDAFAVPSQPRAGAAAILRSAGGALVLAALAASINLSEEHLGGFDVVALPAVYLAFMWVLVVPAMVIEGTGPLGALRQSWRLIHGYGWELIRELSKAWLALFAIALVPIAIASDPGLPYPLRMRLAPIPVAIGYGPFAALALVLIYLRLAAAHRLAFEAAPALAQDR